MIPHLRNPWWQAVAIVAGYAVTLGCSGPIVRWFVVPKDVRPPLPDPAVPQPRYDAGVVIGKCENLLILTMTLLGELQGLSLILGAKTIARMDSIKHNPSYYLGGTLVNLVWSFSMALLIRVVITGQLLHTGS